MTPEEIEKEYDVKNGVIRSPGKFEGEPRYAPYFWSIFLEGGADSSLDNDIIKIPIHDADRQLFPELKDRKWIKMIQDEQGFIRIYCGY